VLPGIAASGGMTEPRKRGCSLPSWAGAGTQGETEEAMKEYKEALRIFPN